MNNWNLNNLFNFPWYFLNDLNNLGNYFLNLFYSFFNDNLLSDHFYFLDSCLNVYNFNNFFNNLWHFHYSLYGLNNGDRLFNYSLYNLMLNLYMVKYFSCISVLDNGYDLLNYFLYFDDPWNFNNPLHNFFNNDWNLNNFLHYFLHWNYFLLDQLNSLILFLDMVDNSLNFNNLFNLNDFLFKSINLNNSWHLFFNLY